MQTVVYRLNIIVVYDDVSFYGFKEIRLRKLKQMPTGLLKVTSRGDSLR
jgi:hypothetical protein